MRILATLAVLVLGLVAGPAHAEPGDPVALLPLDAEPRLEIYGQPVAGEIARALRAGSIDVVVVGPKMGVPGGARLIVDGTIAAGKGSSVVLSIRLRNPVDGTVLDKLDATAPNLAEIDKAAADLSARVLPVVRERIAAQKRQPVDPRPTDGPRLQDVRPVLIGVGLGESASREAEPFRAALAAAVEPWARAARRDPRPVDASTLKGKFAPATVASAKADGAVAFEVLSFSITTHEVTRDGARVQVPLARARVQVRVADPGRVMFDRVIATDTIVGDREMAVDALAARVAREVLAILRPHMRRLVTAWP